MKVRRGRNEISERPEFHTEIIRKKKWKLYRGD